MSLLTRATAAFAMVTIVAPLSIEGGAGMIEDASNIQRYLARVPEQKQTWQEKISPLVLTTMGAASIGGSAVLAGMSIASLFIAAPRGNNAPTPPQVAVRPTVASRPHKRRLSARCNRPLK